MLRVLRRVGIAFGSLVIAWLDVSLIWSLLLPSSGITAALVGLVSVVLGGLIYRDIIRREQRTA